MKVLVVNGSPKGTNSITLQTVLYLEQSFPTCEFTYLHAGARIRSFEKDFSGAAAQLRDAELILFSYPVYTFIAPSQLHRFIELIKENKIDLSGKYVSQITTSKHFYDVTAHAYIQENCQDLGMKFIKGLSADMDDLLKEKGQQEAKAFFHYVHWCMKQDCYEHIPTALQGECAHPVRVPRKTNLEKTAHVPGYEQLAEMRPVVIVADCKEEDVQLQNMIARFRAILPIPTKVVNLRDYPFKGGCLGCFHCAVDGTCIYKDGFDAFLRNEIQQGSSIVYAFTIKDHSMGSLFKLYDDRQFCNGHRTVTMGMPMGYLVSGAYQNEKNLQMIIEGRAEVGGNFLAGVATDEQDTDAAIDQLAKTLTYALRYRYSKPQNFYGVGGMKIFRDLIYLMQGMMKADHKFYKEHGQYDFPQKQKGTLLKMYLVGSLISSPKIQAKIGSKMTEGMLAPYKKILKNAASSKKNF